jgi:hypothetical protein
LTLDRVADTVPPLFGRNVMSVEYNPYLFILILGLAAVAFALTPLALAFRIWHPLVVRVGGPSGQSSTATNFCPPPGISSDLFRRCCG